MRRVRVIIPGDAGRAVVHRVIYEELVAGKIVPTSRVSFGEIIGRMVKKGAEAIILGSTEIMLLVKPADSVVPVFDTTQIHAEAAIAVAPEVPKLGEKPKNLYFLYYFY